MAARKRFQVVTLTDAAAHRVQEIMSNASKPLFGLRVGIKNGGCAGMSYTMEMAEAPAATDEVVEDKGVRILIDPKAVLFLLGTQMDFKVDKLSSGFVFEIPIRPRPAVAAKASPSPRRSRMPWRAPPSLNRPEAGSNHPRPRLVVPWSVLRQELRPARDNARGILGFFMGGRPKGRLPAPLHAEPAGGQVEARLAGYEAD